jgi:3-oxoadipate enol-lactonase
VMLHYEIAGADGAPPLLMGGSLGTTLEMWNGQLPLADAFRLVRFDHRGHGRSDSPPGPYEISDLGHDVLGLMDALEIRRAHYCGLSIGGMVGMWLAARAPERVERLVLLCTAAHMPPPSVWQERAAAVLDAGTPEVIADAVVDRWLTPDFAATHPELRRDLRHMLITNPPHGYASCCGAIARMDLRDALPKISASTLVVSGADDLAAPPDMQVAIAAAIPYARHETVRPAAHIAAVEQPETVNRLIREHLT